MLNPLTGGSTGPAPAIPGMPNPNSYSCCGEASVDGTTGAMTFIELLDTPESYINQAGKVVVVNQSETGLEFVANSSSGWRPAQRIARDDERWTDDHTFTEPQWAGSQFFIYYNGSRILTEEQDGFQILPGGGFTFDPTKFQFYSGEFLYTIF